MAQRVLTTYVDDLTGDEIKDGEGGEVQFGFDGASYVVDLSDTSKAELEKVLSPYLNAARPDRSAKKSTVRKATAGKSDAAQIRAWAKENGWDVPDRGRVSAEVRKAYTAAS